ncbi:ring-cleaving dioxygenase [Lichenibacterium dinghuense]|uniref:ring-cleaving dioxygenase n=1 Tax=Lichenibacterium dinghuense TaxID=2895977 RepID=UPI001F42AECC|nr:ring-cleaving dioxygenase [Lichenibacterium sp. 6Y81]
MVLTGFHHLTAVTADAPNNHRFYTQVLGMRLVKKTVNQDDVSAYHLFYADGLASPGSDVTFFDWPAARERRGSGSVVRTGLRVPGRDALHWWGERLAAAGVSRGGIAERDGRLVLDFEDPEGQRLSLVADPGTAPHHPWARSPVPRDYQVLGLGAITLSTARVEATDAVLRDVLGMERVRSYRDGDVEAHVYAMDGGGETAKELHLLDEPGKPAAGQGAGGVHHVALRTPDEDTYRGWAERLKAMRMPSSGPIDRFYFRSLYFREPGGVLFEIATDGPGFATDEPMERLGETLSLPPFLEGRRREIEAGLKPLDV